MKKQSFKNTYFWFGIFALCFFLFQIISYRIRPNYTGDDKILKYFLGVAPNFFPAIGIPALIFAIIGLFKSNRFKFINENALYVSFWIGLAGLIVWEFLQKFSNNLSFDWHDIIWTNAGGITFLLIGVKMKQKRQHTTNDNAKH